MKVHDFKKADYREYVLANSDPYGNAVVVFGERWACLLEADIEVASIRGNEDADQVIQDRAEAAERAADREVGITGFQYGCAVAALSEFWVYGEALRQWHNLRTQIGDEGERANASGGVLNPALLSMNVEQ